ncbi:TraU domain protein [Burkholderia cenocepacia BC7]|nr:TraU domain protein [Burkholderia cenocepacia BC7]
MASTLSPDCLEYRVTGICYWLYCTWTGCTVRTSVKVRHYIPDAVVSSYSNTGENPWVEVRAMILPNPTAKAGGDGTTNEDHENNLAKFKNADVIGHPGGHVFSQFASASGYTCEGAGTAQHPRGAVSGSTDSRPARDRHAYGHESLGQRLSARRLPASGR